MILDANLAAEEFYGYPREELTRMNMTIINPMPVDELIEKMRGAMESRETYSGPHIGGRREQARRGDILQPAGSAAGPSCWRSFTM
jgi:PAS domain S-box-containing protein